MSKEKKKEDTFEFSYVVVSTAKPQWPQQGWSHLFFSLFFKRNEGEKFHFIFPFSLSLSLCCVTASFLTAPKAEPLIY